MALAHTSAAVLSNNIVIYAPCMAGADDTGLVKLFGTLKSLNPCGKPSRESGAPATRLRTASVMERSSTVPVAAPGSRGVYVK